MATRTIQLGTPEPVNLAYIRDEDYVKAIEEARFIYPVLDDCVIEKRGGERDCDGMEVCCCGNEIRIYPMTVETDRWLRDLHDGNKWKALIHYCLHELGHAAFEIVTGYKYIAKCDGIEDKAMNRRYDREETTVERLAFCMAEEWPWHGLPANTGA